ncbi:MAG: MFS transporter [Candidatus Bathyarchaeia archaeon]
MSSKDVDEYEKRGRGFLTRIASDFSFIRGNFLVLIVSWIILDFARELPGTYYPLYVQALGGTAATLGLIGAASTASQALVQFPGGYLADKIGRRRLIVTMTFTAAFAWLLYALAPSWHFILIGAVVGSLCRIYIPALNAMVMDSIPEERRGTGFGIIFLIEAVSTTPAPLIAGLLYARFGLVPSLRLGYTLAFLLFASAAVLRIRLKETLRDPVRMSWAELLRTIPNSVFESVKVWGRVPRSAFAMFIVNVMNIFSFSMIDPVLLLYIVHDLGISPGEWALLATFLFVVMIVLAIPGGKLIDKVGKKRPLLLSYLAVVPAALLVLYGDLTRLFLALPLWGLVIVLGRSASSALIADLVPVEERGKVSGFGNFFNLISSSLGMLISGYLYDRVSHELPFILQPILAIPPAFLALMFVEEKVKGSEQ